MPVLGAPSADKWHAAVASNQVALLARNSQLGRTKARATPAKGGMQLNWRRPYSPGPLTEQEFDQYWTDGFVIKHGVLSLEQDIQPCLKAIEG